MDNKFNRNTQVQNISRAKDNNIIKDNFIMLSHAANYFYRQPTGTIMANTEI